MQIARVPQQKGGKWDSPPKNAGCVTKSRYMERVCPRRVLEQKRNVPMEIYPPKHIHGDFTMKKSHGREKIGHMENWLKSHNAMNLYI